MLETGIKFTKTETVTGDNTAAKLGSGLLPVYATPAMILLIESAAAESVAPHLDEGCTTVGTKLDVEHLAATPVGMNVSITAELKEVDRRRLVFYIEARDEKELIATAEHERFIVDGEKFQGKANAKLEA